MTDTIKEILEPVIEVIEAIAPDQIQAVMAEWKHAQEQKALFVEREMLLRKRLFKHFFPDAKEGANNFPLGNGWKVTGNKKVNRRIDQREMKNMGEAYNQGLMSPEDMAAWKSIPFDAILSWKPEVKVGGYKKLEGTAKDMVSRFVIESDGSPELEFKPVKA